MNDELLPLLVGRTLSNSLSYLLPEGVWFFQKHFSDYASGAIREERFTIISWNVHVHSGDCIFEGHRIQWMYSWICAQWLELCVQTSARIFIETVDYSLHLTQPPSRHKVGLGSLYRLHREVKSPQGDPSTCLGARWITLPMYPMYLFFFFECRESLGSLPTRDEMSNLSMPEDW